MDSCPCRGLWRQVQHGSATRGGCVESSARVGVSGASPPCSLPFGTTSPCVPQRRPTPRRKLRSPVCASRPALSWETGSRPRCRCSQTACRRGPRGGADPEDAQRRMSACDPGVVVILRDHRQTVGDRCGRDQRIGEPDRAVYAVAAAVEDDRAQAVITASLMGMRSDSRARARVSARRASVSSSVAASTPNSSSPIVTTDTVTRPGRTPSGRFDSPAMKTEVSSRPAVTRPPRSPRQALLEPTGVPDPRAPPHSRQGE